MDYLMQLDPRNPYPILIILDQERMIIGRYTVVSLASYPQVSRYHACFTKIKGTWYVKDLGSRNNLFVNFVKLDGGSQKLDIGDIIGFGTANISDKGSFSCVLKKKVKQEEEEVIPSTPPKTQNKPAAADTTPIPLGNLNIKTENSASSLNSTIEIIDLGFLKCEVSEGHLLNETVCRNNAFVKERVSPNTATEHSRTINAVYSNSLKTQLSIKEAASITAKRENRNEVPSIINGTCLRKIREHKSDGDISCTACASSASDLSIIKEPSIKTNTTEKGCLCTANVLNKTTSFNSIKTISHEPGRLLENITNRRVPPTTVSNEIAVIDISGDIERYSTPNPSTNSNIYPPSGSSNNTFDDSIPSVSGKEIEQRIEPKVQSPSRSTAFQTEVESAAVKLRPCFAKVIKCETKHFKLPPDVKRFNVSDRLSQLQKKLKHVRRVKQTEEHRSKNYQVSDCEMQEPKTSVGNRLRTKESQYLCLSNNVKLKIKQNRILGSDSDASNDDCELEKVHNRPLAVNFYSNEKDSVKNLGESSNSIKIHKRLCSINDRIVININRKRNQSISKELSGKRTRLLRSDDSDSSVSLDSVILYPSSVSRETLERVSNSKSKNALKSNRKSKNDKFNAIKRSNERKTAGPTFLMDPNPIQRRYRRMRGSKEWFQERYNPSKYSKSDTIENTNKSVRNEFPKSIKKSVVDLKNETNISRGPVSTNTSGLNPRQNSMVEVQSELPNAPAPCKDKVKPVRLDLSFQPKQKAKSSILKSPLKTKVRRSIPAVPKRPYKYGSRMNFLVDMEESVDKKHSSIKTTPANETMSSRSKNKCQVHEPNISTEKHIAITSYTVHKTSHSEEKETIENCDVHVKSSASLTKPVPTKDKSIVQISNSSGGNASKKLYRSSKEKSFAVVSPILHYSNQGSEHRTREKISFLFDSHLLIEEVVYWNPKWLEEQRGNEKPPPAILEGASDLPLLFESYESYVSSFYPMIVLETWEALYQKYSTTFLLEDQNPNSFYYSVTSCENKNKMLELRCQAIVSKSLSYRPCEGEVILLSSQKAKSSIEHCIFAYIHEHSIEEIRNEAIRNTKWNAVPSDWFDDAKLWKFSAYIKKRRKPLECGSINLAHGLMNITDKLRLGDALRSFKISPFQKTVLKPNPEAFLLSITCTDMTKRKLLAEINREMRNAKSQVKICLLHGPPGTGKTEFVVNLIDRLFTGTVNPKILVCAPANSAVDEIVSRLIELNERCSWRSNPINFVRISGNKCLKQAGAEGIPNDKSECWKQSHFKVHDYCLENKTFRLCKQHLKKQIKHYKIEKLNVGQKINDILFTKENKRSNYRRKVDGGTIQTLVNKYKSLKEQNILKCHKTQTIYFEKMVLDKSHVIVSTPEIFMQPTMCNLFESMSVSSFTCLIMDAATQLTEPQILQTFTSGVNKLVLMGDYMQLQPLIKSKYALKYGYGRSMFERFCLLFKNQHCIVPFLTFKEQFRMRSEICDFPSNYFYNGELITGRDIDERYVYSPLKPYFVLDEIDDSIIYWPDYPNRKKSHLITYMCCQVLQMTPAVSIGVIVTSEEEVIEYTIALSQNPALKDVEINTLEGYQGREKDVVILFYVSQLSSKRSDDPFACEKRLNVALTRARQCLFIFGYLSALAHHQHWKALLENAKRRNCYRSVSSVKNIHQIFKKETNAIQ